MRHNAEESFTFSYFCIKYTPPLFLSDSFCAAYIYCKNPLKDSVLNRHLHYFKNYAFFFCPVFMRSIWFLKPTKIISVNSLNLKGFVMHRHWVTFEVRTEFLNFGRGHPVVFKYMYTNLQLYSLTQPIILYCCNIYLLNLLPVSVTLTLIRPINKNLKC